MRGKAAVFVDTVGWIALLHRGDDLHNQAVKLYHSLGKIRRVTTDAVLIESCNAFSKTIMRPLAIALMENINKAEQLGVLEIIHVNEEHIDKGWELFKNRLDKEWSLTDCISFTVMRGRRINKALTSDHHFEQAGFEKLL